MHETGSQDRTRVSKAGEPEEKWARVTGSGSQGRGCCLRASGSALTFLGAEAAFVRRLYGLASLHASPHSARREITPLAEGGAEHRWRAGPRGSRLPPAPSCSWLSSGFSRRLRKPLKSAFYALNSTGLGTSLGPGVLILFSVFYLCQH